MVVIGLFTDWNRITIVRQVFTFFFFRDPTSKLRFLFLRKLFKWGYRSTFKNDFPVSKEGVKPFSVKFEVISNSEPPFSPCVTRHLLPNSLSPEGTVRTDINVFVSCFQFVSTLIKSGQERPEVTWDWKWVWILGMVRMVGPVWMG